MESQTMRATKGTMIFIFGVILLDAIGLSMLLPVSAYIVRQYSADALSVMLLTVIFAGAQFLAAPLLGRLSDRYGRRNVLLICVLGSAIGYFVFGIGGALWVLFVSRLIDGFTGGNISVALASIADVTSPENRAKNYAVVGAAFGIGFVLGPAMGGALSQISLAAPAYAAGILSLANFAIGLFALKETLPAEKRDYRPLRLQDANSLASISEFLRRPSLGALLLVYVLFYFTFNSINMIFPVYAIDRFAVTPPQLAGVLAASGIGNIVMQGFLVGRLAPRFGEKALTITGLFAQMVMVLMVYVVPAFWMQYPVVILLTAFNGLLLPTLTALIANGVASQEQGRIAGVTIALGSLMSVIGPLTTGALYDHVGAAAPFLVGSTVLLVAALLIVRLRPSKVIVEPAFEMN